MEFARWQSIAVAIAGALGLGASFPPWSMPWLAPLGVAAFFVSVGRAPRFAASAGAVFGVVFLGLTSWWLVQSIAVAAWATLTLVQAVWFGVLGVAVSLLRRLRWWPVWAACAWTAFESARSAWPWGGFPWGRLGYTAVDTPWVGLLAVFGVAGAGTVIATAGGVVAALVSAVHSRPTVRLPRRRTAVAATACVAAVVGAPVALAASTEAGAPGALGADETGEVGRVRVGVVQAEVPGTGTDVAAHHRTITRTLLDQTRSLADRRSAGEGTPASFTSTLMPDVVPGSTLVAPLDLVVWPENATAVDPETDGEANASLVAAAEAVGAPLLAGSIVDRGGLRALNQSIAWTVSGPGARYTKQHLVPFGEYVPMRWLASRVSDRVGAIARDMTPGPPAVPMRVEEFRVANALCFDVAYDEVLGNQVQQGADFVVVQTSNAMFLDTAQPEQQWAITRARAVEVGRAVVVSSMNGISGVVAPDGSVLERLPALRAGSVVVDVPTGRGLTLAVLVGPWPARGAWAVAVLSILAAALRPESAARATRSGAAQRALEQSHVAARSRGR